MLLLKDIMHAKSFIHHMTTPLQQGEVDHKALLDQANAACRAFHDHSLEYGFLFSKSLDEKMQSAKRKLWELLDEAGPDILEAVKKGENPLRNESVRGVNRRIGKELGPIEIELVAEVRSLLGADLDDEPHSRGIS
jgi:hypothetical protein